MQRLNSQAYMSFPMRITEQGAATSDRSAHVREQIEQVLFTVPGERVFRPEFGAGVRRLVFEPNNHVLRNMTIKRLNASLSEALHGEVDPRTLDVEITVESEKLIITVTYKLAALGQTERHAMVIGGGQ